MDSKARKTSPSAPSFPPRNMNISTGTLKRTQYKNKVPVLDKAVFSSSFTKKIKTNNSQLAKKLAHSKIILQEKTAYCKVLKNSHSDLLMQFNQEFLFHDATYNRVEAYISKCANQMQDCLGTLMLIQEEVNEGRRRVLPNVGLTIGQKSSSKAPNISKTQTVNPMVSGCTITQPCISLSRIDSSILQAPVLHPNGNTEEVGTLVSVPTESELVESNSMELEDIDEDVEVSEDSSDESVSPSAQSHPLPEKNFEQRDGDKILDSDDEENEVSLLSRSKRRRLNRVKKSHPAFYDQVLSEDGQEGTSRSKYRNQPQRIKRNIRPPASSDDDDSLDATSHSTMITDEAIAALSPIKLDSPKTPALSKPHTFPEPSRLMYGMTSRTPKISAEFAKLLGTPLLGQQPTVSRDSALTRPIISGPSNGMANNTTITNGVDFMPSKVPHVNIVPLSESAIAQASARKTGHSIESNHMPDGVPLSSKSNVHLSNSSKSLTLWPSITPSVVPKVMTTHGIETKTVNYTVSGLPRNLASPSKTIKTSRIFSPPTYTLATCSASATSLGEPENSCMSSSRARTESECSITSVRNPESSVFHGFPDFHSGSSTRVSAIENSPQITLKTDVPPTKGRKHYESSLHDLKAPLTPASTVRVERGTTKSATSAHKSESEVPISKSAGHVPKKVHKSNVIPCQQPGIENVNTPKSTQEGVAQKKKNTSRNMLPRVVVNKLDASMVSALNETSKTSISCEPNTGASSTSSDSDRTRSALRRIAPPNYKERSLNTKLRREDDLLL